MTFPHTLQERKGPFACPRCGFTDAIRFVTGEGLAHRQFYFKCTWLDEATDEQVEALK